MRTGKAQKAYGVGHILLFILLVLCLLYPARRVQAEEYGSLELQFDQKAAGAELTLYSVAAYQDGSFVMHGVFESCGISLNGLSDAQAAEQTAEQLAALAKEKGAQGIAKTVGTDGILRYTELVPGYYLLAQTGGLENIEIQKLMVPIPYTMENGSLRYDAVLAPKYSIPDGAVLLTKVDDAGAAVAGAMFDLQRKVYISETGEAPEGAETGQDGGGRFCWETVRQGLVTDQKGELAAGNLVFGTYRFVETAAPAGFILNTAPGYAAVAQAGTLQASDNGYQTVSGEAAKLTFENKRTTVKVAKVDENGKPLAGAKLIVKTADGKTARGSDGKVLFSFTSAEEPTELRQLPAGEYLLSEVEAPDGYLVSADVPFTVTDESDTVTTVTMTDQREDKTEASLKVTKSLVDDKNLALTAEDATYYVALFSDEARTQRVSDVKALHYKGSASESVTFNNLVFGQKYYVGETDEGGVLIDNRVYGNGVFAPEYPEQIGITPTRQRAASEFVFDNKYYELPPLGYYYGGKLTITKKVLRGTEAFNTKKVFYATIFEDAEHTKRYGDVLKLEMDGKSETSVTVSVTIGLTADSSMTYYVAETDENGNVLDPDSGLAFEVSIDKAKLVMSPEKPEQTVTITNRFDEDETETDAHEGSGGNTGTPGSSGSGGRNPVRTGDETPVGAVVTVMVAAAAVIVILILLKKRKRRK